MILKLEQKTSQKDIEILITYPVKDKTLDHLVLLLKSVNEQIECYSDDSTQLINVSDIYYIESVDKKTVVCCEKENYQNKSRLYQLYEKLAEHGFVQISKYCIMNVNKLEKITPLVNSHLEALLSNGKCLYVTRKYLSEIKRILKENK